MNYQEDYTITCPYCGETITILIECSYDTQEYTEDCQVCCRPITIIVQNSDGNSIQVSAKHENE